jgi:hypothetical protein
LENLAEYLPLPTTMTNTAGAEMRDTEKHNDKANGFVDKVYSSQGKRAASERKTSSDGSHEI